MSQHIRQRRSRKAAEKPSENGHDAYQIVRKRVSSLKQSPENLNLYNPVDADDHDMVKLAESIAREGLHEPLVITLDGFIVSGHRRHIALQSINQVLAPCRVLDVRRADMTTDEYVSLLRDHNRQRHKSIAEQVREELVDIDPEQAIRNLHKRRKKSVNGYRYSPAGALPDSPPFKPRGYFQLWNARDPAYRRKPVFDCSFIHAGRYDTLFYNQWPREKWVDLKIKLTHHGMISTNWFGAENPDTAALTEAAIRSMHVR